MDVKDIVNDALEIEKLEVHPKVRELGKYVTFENYEDSVHHLDFPPSRVDSAGYISRTTLVKRFLQDGLRLDEYRHSEEFAESIKQFDEQLPVDNMLYMDRHEALMEVKRLKGELDSIRESRNSVKMSTEVGTTTETVSSAEPTVTDSD